MKKGDICTIDLPYNYGNEQSGVRPAIIVVELKVGVAVVIPFTSNTKALRFDDTLLIEPSTQNGLSEQSVALIFQIRAIDKSRIIKKIGEL